MSQAARSTLPKQSDPDAEEKVCYEIDQEYSEWLAKPGDLEAEVTVEVAEFWDSYKARAHNYDC